MDYNIYGNGMLKKMKIIFFTKVHRNIYLQCRVAALGAYELLMYGGKDGLTGGLLVMARST